MTIVVTGIGGLLGRELAFQALARGYRVIGLTRRATPDLEALGIEIVVSNFADDDRDWSPIAGDAVVFHLAASTSIHTQNESVHQESVRATRFACRVAQKTGGRMVFFSSAAVYSGIQTQHPISLLSENSPTQPVSLYGQAKKDSEDLIAQSGVSAILLRIFGVLSESLLHSPNRGNLVQAIVHSLATDAPLTLLADSNGRTTVRDYALASDVCRMALNAGQQLMADGSKFAGAMPVNFCTGIPTSTAEMAGLAQVATLRTFPVIFRRRQSSENPVMVGDTSRLRQMLGQVPRSSINEFWQRVAARGLLTGSHQAPIHV